MGLKETNKIDIIIKDPFGAGYRLIAYDTGDIPDEIQRYNCLNEKLMTYVEYVKSGQVYEQCPDAKNASFIITVVCITPPNEAMKKITAIKSIDSNYRLPVEIYTDTEFKDKIKLSTKPKEKPWWKFW